MLVAVFTLLTGVAFPLAFVGLGQAVYPDQANGSLIRRDGQVIGSALIGQDFTAAWYFHPRPSATSEHRSEGPVEDDAGAVRGGQLGRIQSRADRRRR